jgi:hypothetical protein
MSTVVVQEPVEPLVLGEVVGYGGADTVVDTMAEKESIAEAEGEQIFILMIKPDDRSIPPRSARKGLRCH